MPVSVSHLHVLLEMFALSSHHCKHLDRFMSHVGNRSNAAHDLLLCGLIATGRIDYHVWMMVEQQLGFQRHSPLWSTCEASSTLYWPSGLHL
jgi:hypothetical protein